MSPERLTHSIFDLPTPDSSEGMAATLEESLNQLLQFKEQMNLEIDAHVDRLREMRQEVEAQAAVAPEPAPASHPGLFEADPVGAEFEKVEAPPIAQVTRVPAIAEPSINPDLEQATLDELNAALAMAFSQVAPDRERAV